MSSGEHSEILIPEMLVQAVREQPSLFPTVVRKIARRPEHLESVTEEHIQVMTLVRDALLARIAAERALDEQHLAYELARNDQNTCRTYSLEQSPYFVRNNQV